MSTPGVSGSVAADTTDGVFATAGAGAVAGDRPSTFLESYREQLRADLSASRLIRLAAVTVEFALVLVAIKLTNLETQSFETVVTLAFAGFLVHHFLPAAWRLNFFALLSVASVPLIFGWQQGLWLLALGGFLIALCHLPVAMPTRIVLLILCAGIVAGARLNALPVASPIPIAVWPILGSMFMFRIIVYLYDLHHRAAPFTVGRALGYFFMLPNVCFPLFPVVDYKTLQRSAYNEDPLRLYHTGVKWMLRGLVHLALYQIVYLAFVVDPGSVQTGAGAGRYMLATFLLYLKISGLFHLIVGILHLYGFGLAETHHLYLFSSSFTDFWRRINIYWKDFIQKLVFNPSYLFLRRLGERNAIIVTTLLAFTATWFFHSYQWFWIRGTFPIVWSDLVFWFGLGVLVVVNVLIETRKGRKRGLATRTATMRDNVVLALKIAATFTAICVLWTVWSTPDLAEIENLARALAESGPLDLGLLLGFPIAVGVAGIFFRNRRREVFGGGNTSGEKAFWREAALIGAIAIVLAAIGQWPGVLKPISPTFAQLADDIRSRTQLNAVDFSRLQRGYYEELGDVTGQSRPRKDGIETDFVPSTAMPFMGAYRTINSQGLRDREYPLLPGKNTFRIGVVGASHDMGWGVDDDETYENVVEDRLNRELGPKTGKKFEILNFSNGWYGPTQKLSMIESHIFGFRPDLILYVANVNELDWVFKSIDHMVRYRLLDQFPAIARSAEAAGLKFELGKPIGNKRMIEHQLAPFAESALLELLAQFRDDSLARGIRPAAVFLEIPEGSQKSVRDRIASIMHRSQLPFMSLYGAFAGVADTKTLWISPEDAHTNAQGHRLLADRLYKLLIEQGLVPTEPVSPADQAMEAGTR